jgi:cytochrome bd ubiquinol oxidase subunit I
MDAVDVSRLQFGITIGFHYLYPPLTIGLGVVLVILEGMFLRTKNPLYQQATKFWVRVFGLIFALGVATGIVQEFQFGTNWANYSRFVGDVFGTALAAEGIFAFFLESGFLAVLLFGWDRVSPRVHFISTIMVCLGSHFSAVWIVIANSWMQTPAGYRLVTRDGVVRAEATNFWDVVFNPSSVERLAHVFMGAWQAGAFLVLSVSAWHLLHERHQAFAKASFKVGLVVAVLAAVGSIVTGDISARVVADHQPAKLAAMEGVYRADSSAGLHLFGWVDEGNQKVYGPQIPGGLSWLLYEDTDAPVTGLQAFSKEDWPPVERTFQSFHLMVAIGFATFGLTLLALLFLWRGSLFQTRWLMWLFVVAIIGPMVANQVGWLVAEFGRQPWVVYGLMRTEDAVSPSVRVSQVWSSVIMFSLVYSLLLALFLYLLNQKIRHGPLEEDLSVLPANRRQHLTASRAQAEAD